MDSNLTLNKIQQSLYGVVAEFSKNPADFLYESDLQCMLYGNMRNNFSECLIRSEAKDLEQLFNYRPLINPVKSEYPYNVEGLRAKFDLAILDDVQDPLFRIWWQSCKVGIEIKLWQSDGTGNDVFSDVNKLKSYLKIAQSRNKEFTGISLLFVHPCAEKRLAQITERTAPTLSVNSVSLHVVTRTEWSGIPV